MVSILDLTGLSQLRARWRKLLQRVEQLDKRLCEVDEILDLLVADSAFRSDPATGMNGQQKRKEIIETICRQFRPELAVETGTHFGRTTGYLAATLELPVISCELRERYHQVARRLLREVPNVELRLQDSRSLLRDLASNIEKTDQRTLFYLDAHWYGDLPLCDELEIIALHWPQFVAVIDDFEVPDEPDYGCGDGAGRRLNLSLIQEILKKHALRAFFPRGRAREETGARRGCCIVVPERSVEALEGAQHLVFDSAAP